jgi:hypothetical protein
LCVCFGSMRCYKGDAVQEEEECVVWSERKNAKRINMKARSKRMEEKAMTKIKGELTKRCRGCYIFAQQHLSQN